MREKRLSSPKLDPDAMKNRQSQTCLVFCVAAVFLFVVVESRQILSGERGCYQVKNKESCCNAIDGRFTTDGNLFGGFPGRYQSVQCLNARSVQVSGACRLQRRSSHPVTSVSPRTGSTKSRAVVLPPSSAEMKVPRTMPGWMAVMTLLN